MLLIYYVFFTRLLVGSILALGILGKQKKLSYFTFFKLDFVRLHDTLANTRYHIIVTLIKKM